MIAEGHATYLDCNATAPLLPAVAEAMAAAQSLAGNPSSVHRFGRLARAEMETARERIAAHLNCRPAEIVFTSGGTEANNLALAGADWRCRIVSAIEHDSVLRARADTVLAPVLPSGRVDLDALASLLADRPPPVLVSVMLANNETGIVQPVAEIAAVAHAVGAVVHSDAVQAFGKISIDFAGLGIDLLTVAPHKFGGPKGIGALVVRESQAVASLIKGGGQERGRRAGTENVAAIVGFGVAAEQARVLEGRMAALAAWRDRLESTLRAGVPGLQVFGDGESRLPNTSCFALPGWPSENQVIALDLAGFAVSAGSACSSGKVRSSHVLSAMGASAAAAASAIRVSLGWHNTPAEVEGFAAAWCNLARRYADSFQPLDRVSPLPAA